MKVKAILFGVALLLASAVVCSAQSPQMGTWKVNEAKSKFAKGATKNHTVTYEAAGDMTKVTVDGTDGDGNAVHSEWTGKFNGRSYDVTGSQTANKRAYRMINSRTLSFTERQGKAVAVSGRIVVSRDGKTRTVTSTSKDTKGKWIHNTAVYDKQ